MTGVAFFRCFRKSNTVILRFAVRSSHNGCSQMELGHMEKTWIPGDKTSRRESISASQNQELVQFSGKTFSCENSRERIVLSRQQKGVLQTISEGKSVFITGSAGTGKSFLLESAIQLLKMAHGSNSVFVTASTGIAAFAIGGTTLHSFAGIGLGVDEKEILAIKVTSSKDAKKRWRRANVLIIDEISMINGELFDKLDFVARVVRCKNEVFGGLQLVVSGDFFQLPPVNVENERKYFAFNADCWNRCFDLQVELIPVFRQADAKFVAMLNEIRRGHCSPVTLKRLQCCMRPIDDFGTGILPTKLYPLKVDVSGENEKNLNALEGPTYIFIANDKGCTQSALDLLQSCQAVTVFSLRLGAQVMLVKNLDTDSGLINGARGVIVGFTSTDSTSDLSVSPGGVWPVVRFAHDRVERVVKPHCWSVMEGTKVIATRVQVPLILAWALSVHKCQGMTLDRVETDLSKSFTYGMVYAALSRVKSLDGLHLVDFHPSSIKVHPQVVNFYKELKSTVFSEKFS